ncbi:MAG: ferric reductase-like transmembrane domain-containing protein [Coriobacteriia bacterium]|nr:ferric reductase-like transmembrane domain-containing protein [Coriobacteriia bacterium]MBS5479338.1 ferric reductase-like transmembrane domain-containing protein [Coriobacteriia bacterium]
MIDVSSLIALGISLVVAMLLAFPLAKTLRDHATPFYVGAFVVVAAYVWAVSQDVNLRHWQWATFVLQKGYLSSVLLGIVMFTGCLDASSKLRHQWRLVRGELSVLSFIFILGHLAVFLPSYLERLLGGAVLKVNVRVSIVVALVLAVIFVALGVMSFRTVRRHMNPRVWKNIQRLAYLMVALYLAHILFFLGTSALGGSHKGLASLIVYTVLVVLYAVLRVRRALIDRRAASGVA